jgi:hypothetical protein
MALTYSWCPWTLALLCAVVARAISRRYWTSIGDVPGPLLASFSSLWQVMQILKGHTELETIRLHRQHGMLVPLISKVPLRESSILTFLDLRLFRSHRSK